MLAAVGQGPFGHLPNPVPLDQRLRLVDLEVVELITLLAADGEDVPKASGGDQGHVAGLALDDDVGAQRGSVDGPRQLRAGHAGLCEQLVQTRQAGLARIGVSGQAFVGVEAALRVLEDEVGEGAAHVESDLDGSRFHAIGPSRVVTSVITATVLVVIRLSHRSESPPRT